MSIGPRLAFTRIEPLPPEAEAVLSNMLFFLSTGWHAWGFKPNLEREISLCDGRWILCCGNVLTKDEGDAAAARGLLSKGKPDRFGRPTLILGAEGETFLEKHWPKPPYETGREDK